MFEDFKMNWKGREITIPARRVLGAIATCETHITMPELEQFMIRRTLPFGRIAQAYAAVLQYAGVPVDGDEVYATMLAQGAVSLQDVGLRTLTELQSLMIPPHLRNKMVEVPDQGNAPTPAAAEAPAGVKEQSKDSTKPSSATRQGNGSRRKRSGK